MAKSVFTYNFKNDTGDASNTTGFLTAFNFGDPTTNGGITENGVTFTFSVQATGVNSGAFVGNVQTAIAVTAEDGVGGSDTAQLTLDINDNASNDFFVNPVLDFLPTVAAGSANTITFIQSKTTGGGATNITTKVVNPGTGSTTVNGTWNKIVFSTTNNSGTTTDSFVAISSITAALSCFCAGTLVETPDGLVPVERLTAGDRVLTADGCETTVKWLGEQPVNTRLSHPAKVNPICIAAGALGGGLPERDLLLSPDHAIALDGVLVNAGALVNGTTIYQVRDMPLDGFTYYHVETDAHELILAEGVAAETFIDYAGADSFVNGEERGEAVIPEMPLPRISSPRLLPDPIRARLAARAAEVKRPAA